MTDVSKEYLDLFAEQYYLDEGIDDIDIEDTMQIYSFEKIKEQIGNSKRILDMGVGTGTFLNELTQNFDDISVL